MGACCSTNERCDVERGIRVHRDDMKRPSGTSSRVSRMSMHPKIEPQFRYHALDHEGENTSCHFFQVVADKAVIELELTMELYFDDDPFFESIITYNVKGKTHEFFVSEQFWFDAAPQSAQESKEFTS